MKGHVSKSTRNIVIFTMGKLWSVAWCLHKWMNKSLSKISLRWFLIDIYHSHSPYWTCTEILTNHTKTSLICSNLIPRLLPPAPNSCRKGATTRKVVWTRAICFVNFVIKWRFVSWRRWWLLLWQNCTRMKNESESTKETS